jgi:GT2 family glycosyltransferase
MKFSIVIPNYNGAHLIRKNLPVVLEAVKDAEVIVVDDASNDDSVKLLKSKFPQVRLVVNPKNLRFAKACNAGVNKAKGEVIVLLNNDVWPEKDFLKPLKSHFTDKQVFAVGCMEIVDSKTRGKSTGKFEKGLLVHEGHSAAQQLSVVRNG